MMSTPPALFAHAAFDNLPGIPEEEDIQRGAKVYTRERALTARGPEGTHDGRQSCSQLHTRYMQIRREEFHGAPLRPNRYRQMPRPNEELADAICSAASQRDHWQRRWWPAGATQPSPHRTWPAGAQPESGTTSDATPTGTLGVVESSCANQFHNLRPTFVLNQQIPLLGSYTHYAAASFLLTSFLLTTFNAHCDLLCRAYIQAKDFFECSYTVKSTTAATQTDPIQATPDNTADAQLKTPVSSPTAVSLGTQTLVSLSPTFQPNSVLPDHDHDSPQVPDVCVHSQSPPPYDYDDYDEPSEIGSDVDPDAEDFLDNAPEDSPQTNTVRRFFCPVREDVDRLGRCCCHSCRTGIWTSVDHSRLGAYVRRREDYELSWQVTEVDSEIEDDYVYALVHAPEDADPCTWIQTQFHRGLLPPGVGRTLTRHCSYEAKPRKPGRRRRRNGNQWSQQRTGAPSGAPSR